MLIEARVVELYVTYKGIHDTEEVRKLVYTNAPDDVIISVCSDIKRDKILNQNNGISGIIGVLKARGYKCHVVDNIPQFGFEE